MSTVLQQRSITGPTTLGFSPPRRGVHFLDCGHVKRSRQKKDSLLKKQQSPAHPTAPIAAFRHIHFTWHFVFHTRIFVVLSLDCRSWSRPRAIVTRGAELPTRPYISPRCFSFNPIVRIAPVRSRLSLRRTGAMPRASAHPLRPSKMKYGVESLPVPTCRGPASSTPL